MSAKTDLTIYDQNREPILNVEFKAKGHSTLKHNLLPIEKDLQKLMREPITGMWFHIFETVNNLHILNLFDTITEALHKNIQNFKNDIKRTRLIFHLSILRQGFSLHKQVLVEPENRTVDDLKKHFRFTYKVTLSSLSEAYDSNSWNLHQL